MFCLIISLPSLNCVPHSPAFPPLSANLINLTHTVSLSHLANRASFVVRQQKSFCVKDQILACSIHKKPYLRATCFCTVADDPHYHISHLSVSAWLAIWLGIQETKTGTDEGKCADVRNYFKGCFQA